MFPQLNLSSGHDPARVGRVLHSADAESGSGSDTASVGQTSSTSGKFEEAMEMYHQSMAVRRRKMSMSASTMRSLESASGESADTTTVQSSTSLRGPQLRPSTRLTRVNASFGSSQQNHVQSQSTRSVSRLPSIASPAHGLPLSYPHVGASTDTRAGVNASAAQPALTASYTHAVRGCVVRRSTRRPLSRGPAPTSPNSSAASNKLNDTSTSLLCSTSLHPQPERRSSSELNTPQRKSSCLSSEISAEEADELSDHADSVLGSLHQLPRPTSVDDHSQATNQPSVFHSRGSTRNFNANPASTSKSRSPRRAPSAGSKSNCSQDPSTGSYDIMGLDSILMASEDDLRPLRQLSLYVPPQTRKQPPQGPPVQLKPKAPASRPASAASRRFSLASASGAASTSLLLSHADHPSAALLSAKAAAALSHATTSTNTTTTAATAAAPSSTQSAAAVPLMSGSTSLDLTSVRTPGAPRTLHAGVAGKTTTATTPAATTANGGRSADTSVRSISQAGLSSAANNSESRHTAGALRRRSTAAATAVVAEKPNGTGSGGLAPAAAAAPPVPSPVDFLGKRGVAAPPLTPLLDKQTAQFYHTASLAKTYNGSEFLNDYILISEIGSGATGRVVLAFSTSMNCSVAIKIILKPQRKKYRLQRTRVSSDSSVATSHASETHNSSSNNGNGRRGSAGQQVIVANGRYGDLLSSTSAVGALSSSGVGGGGGGGAAAAARPTTPPSRNTNNTAANATRGASPSDKTGGNGTTKAKHNNNNGGGGGDGLRFTTADRMTRNLQREIDVMKDLNHPNIVRLYEVINDPKENSLYLILQYVDSGAVAQLDSAGCIAVPFLPDELLPIATQVIDGLVYLHEHCIVHRDIKPENILVNRDGQAFLADFGVAELMNAESGMLTADKLAYQGTPAFMAPEIYATDDGIDDDTFMAQMHNAEEEEEKEKRNAKVSNGEPAAAAHKRTTGSGTSKSSKAAAAPPPRAIDPYALDVWALGVTFYTLLLGHVPYRSMVQIRETVRKGVDIPDSLPDAWRTVLLSTMQPDCSRRVSSSELQRMLHAMRDATTDGSDRSNHTGDGDTVSRRDRLRREQQQQQQQQQRARSRCTSRQPRSATRASRVLNDDDEDVILGSVTPDEVPMVHLSDGLADDESDLSACNFSINSSVMNVLRPSHR